VLVGGRAGYQFWMGIDRPSPDHANAEVILLISAHLETGHYFNPHAQRIIEAKANGAKLIVLDVRLSNTATHADHWLAPYPGSEAAICLAIANHLIQTGRYDRDFVRRWWNWQSTWPRPPGRPRRSRAFEAARAVRRLHVRVRRGRVRRRGDKLEQVAEVWPRPARGCRRTTGAGGRRQRGRLAGLAHPVPAERPARARWPCRGRPTRTRGTSSSRNPIHKPPHPAVWNELTYPLEYPLAQNELSFLLPHFLKEGRGKVDVYFTRVYNPVWTNPDGFSWIEVLTDPDLVGLHVALTPTWNETAYFADYVLPMGLPPSGTTS
jgi:anaerobic selenocysteine-containing dehydrogenase